MGADEKLFLFSKFCTLLSIQLFRIVHFAPMFGVGTLCVCAILCYWKNTDSFISAINLFNLKMKKNIQHSEYPEQ